MSTGNGGGLRKRRAETFVQIRSKTITDGSIPFRALGVLAYLLDRPEGWDVRAEQMAKGKGREGREGREAVRTALRELAMAGYYRLERRQMRTGKWAMGTAISETPVESWAQQARFFEGKAVPMVEQPDGTFMVRYPDGTLQPDDFPPPEQPADADETGDPEGDDTDGTEDGFLGTGDPTSTGDGFPGPGFPAPGNPASGGAAPGNASPKTEGVTQRGYTDSVPPSEVRPADDGLGGKPVQPTLTGDVSDVPQQRSPEEPTVQQRAFGIARGWMDWRASQNTPVVGNNALHRLRSLIEPALKAGYTDDEVKRAINGLGEGIPSKAQLDRALARVRKGRPVANGGRYTPPPGALDVNAQWDQPAAGQPVGAGAAW